LVGTSRWDSTLYLLKWKATATPQGRLLFRLQASTPSTKGTGSGSSQPDNPWPTPTTTERPNEGNVRTLRAKVLSGEISHEDATAMLGKSPLEGQGKIAPWPTPTTQDSENNAGPSQWRRNTPPLNTAVATEPGQKLHGRWTLALMGFPPDWCDGLPPDPLG